MGGAAAFAWGRRQARGTLTIEQHRHGRGWRLTGHGIDSIVEGSEYYTKEWQHETSSDLRTGEQ